MDIKDFILIGGGILIAMVIGHGFWIAIRAKRETLRMDIVPDLIPDDDIDDIERFRGELPNGPARVREQAFSMVRTKWIGFVDDDDTLTRDYIHKLRSELEQTPGADAVLFRMASITSGPNEILPPPDARDIVVDQVGISFALRTELVSPAGFGLRVPPSSCEDYDMLEMLSK